MSTDITIKELLEAGAHFGHKSAIWNPKMDKYIFMKRKGIHILDLQKTALLFERACNYIKNIVASGGKVMFVGTKKQARDIISRNLKDSGHFYMTHRWVGGLLTNFDVVKQSIDRLKEYNAILEDETKQKPYMKKDLFKMKKRRDHLNQTFEGVLEMKKIPDMMFIVDTSNEVNCVAESKLCRIPICAMVDTNSDPENINIVIPANDDAIRSIGLFIGKAVDAIKEGEAIYKSNQDELALFEEQIKEEVKEAEEKELQEVKRAKQELADKVKAEKKEKKEARSKEETSKEQPKTASKEKPVSDKPVVEKAEPKEPKASEVTETVEVKETAKPE